MLYDTGNKLTNFIIDLIGFLSGLLIIIALVIGIVRVISSWLYPIPTDYSGLLVTYLGLPLAVWFVLGCGFLLHGFKLISVNIEIKNEKRVDKK